MFLLVKGINVQVTRMMAVRAVRPWNQLPREVVGSPTLEGLQETAGQGCFEADSSNEQRVGLDGLVGPFQLYYSMIL